MSVQELIDYFGSDLENNAWYFEHNASGADRQTHTHTDTDTRTLKHTHTDICTQTILRNHAGVRRLQAGAHLV